MDKAEPADQNLPWDKRKRRDDADMGRAHTLPAGRLHQVPDQGRNQPDGDHGTRQGAPDGQQPSAGAALARQKDAGKATRLERASSIGAVRGVFTLKFLPDSSDMIAICRTNTENNQRAFNRKDSQGIMEIPA